MKKLLLLALTLGAATALTACGGAEKAVDAFLENHTDFLEGSEITNNYTVAVGGDTFKVDGNILNNGVEFFEVNSDNTASYWYNETYREYSWTNTEDQTGSTSDSNSEVLFKESLTAAEFKAQTNAYNAYVGPFAQLAAAQSAVLEDNELSSKFFATEIVGEGDAAVETIYFVVDKETTVDTSPMTIVFDYAEKSEGKLSDEFQTATVTYNKTTWVYTNLSNEDYEYNTSTAHSLTTPGTTWLENIAAIANAKNNMTVTFSYAYSESNNTTVTAVINDGVYKFTGSNVANQYVVANEDETYTVYTEDGSDWWLPTTVETLAEVPMLDKLLTVLNHEAIDPTLMNDQYNYSGGSNAYFNTNTSKISANDLYVTAEVSTFNRDGDITITVGTYNSGARGDSLDVDALYTIKSFDTYTTVGEGDDAYVNDLAHTVSTLKIVNVNFKTIVEMINATTANALTRNYVFTNSEGVVRNVANGLIEEVAATTVDGVDYNDYYIEIGHSAHSGDTTRDRIYVAGSGNWSKTTASALSYGSIGSGVTDGYSAYSFLGNETKGEGEDAISYAVYQLAITTSNGQNVTVYAAADLADCYVIAGQSLNEGLTPKYVTYTNFGAVTVTLPTVGDAAQAPSTDDTTTDVVIPESNEDEDDTTGDNN